LSLSSENGELGIEDGIVIEEFPPCTEEFDATFFLFEGGETGSRLIPSPEELGS